VRREKHTDPKLCDFNSIQMKVPWAKLISLFWSNHILSTSEFIFLKRILRQAEHEENKIKHIKSLACRMLLR